MNYDSVLNGTVLSNQCNDLANNLKYEIAFYNSEITAINTYIESDTISETADKIRGNAAIMIQALKSMITADECDIRDFNRLSEMVNGVNIDGYEVLTRLKEAQRNADDCNNQAEEYSRMALSCPIGSISDHFYDLANSYRGYAASWDRISNSLHKIEIQYDNINDGTSHLFTEGNTIRSNINIPSSITLTNCSVINLANPSVVALSAPVGGSDVQSYYSIISAFLSSLGYTFEEIDKIWLAIVAALPFCDGPIPIGDILAVIIVIILLIVIASLTIGQMKKEAEKKETEEEKDSSETPENEKEAENDVNNGAKGEAEKEREVVTTNQGNEIDITPSENHKVTTKGDTRGEPNSSEDIVDENGNIKTRRWFDENCKAYRDVDMTDHGNSKNHPEVPHEHKWDWNCNPPRQ